jgi:hypothetical protein
MQIRLMTIAAAVGVLWTAGGPGALDLVAQPSSAAPPDSAEGRIPITLVLVESGLPPLVLRRQTQEPRNVVLVDASTVDAEQLSSALVGLLIAEQQDPRGATRGDNAAVRHGFREGVPAYPWANGMIARLQAATVRHVPGIGERPAIVIWLPPIRVGPGRPGVDF